MNSTITRTLDLRVALVAASSTLLVLAGCGSSAKAPIVDAAGGGSAADVATCPASCDDQNDCTMDSCDATTYQCIHQPLTAGTSCNAHDLCTSNDTCNDQGACLSGPRKTCTALDQCHEPGVCIQSTGACSNPNSGDGKACNDALNCTYGDQCLAGVCHGTPVPCPLGAICAPDRGVCIRPGDAGDLPLFPTSLAAGVFENADGPTNSNALARTTDGRIIVAGTFHDTTDLGTGPITTGLPGTSNVGLFVAELNPDTAKAVWTQSLVGEQAHTLTAMAVNGAGQLGLVGAFPGNLGVGGTSVDSEGIGAQYILGIDSVGGSDPWIRQAILQTNDPKKCPNLNGSLVGIAGDPQSSSLVVCGTVACRDATDLSPSLAGKAQGGKDVVVASLDGSSKGTTNWAIQVGGTNDETCSSVAVDAQSNTYVLGTYQFGSTVDFGSSDGPLPLVTKVGTSYLFLSKLDPTGEGIWAIALGRNAQTIVPMALLVVGTDIVVAASISTGDLLLSDARNPSHNPVDLGGSHTFVVRIDAESGVWKWVQPLGGAGNLLVKAMAEGASGGLLLTGSYFSGVTKLGDTDMSAANIYGAMFVAELGADGTLLAAKGYGDPTAGSAANGIIRRTDGSGATLGASLLLGSFRGSTVALGPQVGILTRKPNSDAGVLGVSGALFAVELAP